MGPTGNRVASIVEDEPLIRTVLADALEDMGFEVVQAASAREGMAAVQRLITLQVAFVDVGLPDRRGIDLASDRRARWPELRIAIATGYGSQAVGKFINGSTRDMATQAVRQHNVSCGTRQAGAQ